LIRVAQARGREIFVLNQHFTDRGGTEESLKCTNFGPGSDGFDLYTSVSLSGPRPCVLFVSCGIVSKRLGSRYRSGRSPDWLKMKNPACAAVKREAEEDWAR
jgi:hypothetical protein